MTTGLLSEVSINKEYEHEESVFTHQTKIHLKQQPFSHKASWLTDIAHHHLAIAFIFLIAGHMYRTNFGIQLSTGPIESRIDYGFEPSHMVS